MITLLLSHVDILFCSLLWINKRYILVNNTLVSVCAHASIRGTLHGPGDFGSGRSGLHDSNVRDEQQCVSYLIEITII